MFGLTSKKKVDNLNQQLESLKEEIEASYVPSNELYSHIFSVSFDGEKTAGEIGQIKDYKPDYLRLRARSWQSFLESDITQDVIKKYVLWVCGGGLKLQSEPLKVVLKENKIEIDHERFSESIEARFGMFLKSSKTDYAGETSINSTISELAKNAYIGGDCLVIQRIQRGKHTVQIVDGSHIITPHSTKQIIEAKQRGHTIVDGVEINKKGSHIAYFIKKDNFTFDRVLAKDSRGRKMAFLVYGMKYRINDTRGIPLIVAVMETLKMLDRYKQATVGSAEERQKIAFSIEHDKESTGENPLIEKMKLTTKAKDNTTQQYLNDVKELQGQIALTSQKSVYNMPNGATLKALQSDNELSFKEFFSTNVEIVCACIGIPPEIALSKYDSNFSASRAAIKDWEHTLTVARRSLGEQFYKPIFDLWLDNQVLNDKVLAKGYKQAIFDENDEILESYRNARWTGASVPHIDPLKEVQAERLKLGTLAAHLPLTTLEKATENVNGGESGSNIEQFNKEITKVKDTTIQPIQKNNLK